jgi:hypothetical protein
VLGCFHVLSCVALIGVVMSILNENELNDAIVSTLMKSAYGGNVSHQVDLAYRYLTGYGFDQSIMDGYAWAYVATQKGSDEGEELMELIWLHFTSDLKQRNAILAAKSLYAEVEIKNHLIHCAAFKGCVIDCSFQTVDQLVFLFFTPQRVQALVFFLPITSKHCRSQTILKL